MAHPICRIIQISDTHLLQDPEGELLGVKTKASFQAVIELLKTKTNIDFLLHTGDISQDQSVHSYITAAALLKPLGLTTYAIAGNHDDNDIMQQVYPKDGMRTDKQIIVKNWQFILLNSRKPGAVEGFLSVEELAFLEECLVKNPQHHAVILLHHHPFSVGTTWLDPIGLTNASAFWTCLDKYPNAKYILFGHVHQAFERHYHHVQCYAAPSTSVQFKPNTIEFALDHIPQGYRWINLYEDGHLETGIERISHYSGIFQQAAKGY